MSTFPALYKKKQGTITVIDSKVFQWTQDSLASNTIQFALDEVSALQATPPTQPKHLLKISCYPKNSEARDYPFGFPDRDSLDKVKSMVQELVQKLRTAASREASQTSAANGSPTVSGRVVELDSKKLIKNTQLQEMVLKENKQLFRTFQETVMKGEMSNLEFWSTRIHLLRNYALSSTQKKGAYNVLGTIKPTTGTDNRLNLSLTREKIHDIFEQYPIVQQAYNENVPQLTEAQFWERFFQSRLFRKLRGERITANDPMDAVLDRYLTIYEDEGMKRKLAQEEDRDTLHVPQFLDIEGNQENASEKLGNRPDLTMRSVQDSVSLLRAMNSLSQRMIYGTEDGRVIAQREPSESTQLAEELNLKDLDNQQSKVPVAELHLVNERNKKSKMNNGAPGIDQREINNLKSSFNNSINFSEIGGDPDIFKKADDQITSIIRQRAIQEEGARKWNDDSDKRLIDEVQITHATSIEFLRHFWTHFLSGDPSQASGVAKLVASLKKSIQRLDAVVAQSPKEHQHKVQQSLAPLLKSIRCALERYDKAVKAESLTA